MSTHNIRFYGELTKIILELSSNTQLICFSAMSSYSNFRREKKNTDQMDINFDDD